MDNFRFYQDCKVTCWERDYFTVEAENYEEAVAIVRSWKCEDVTNIIDSRLHLERNEVLRDTSERIFPNENGGCPTMEIYNVDGLVVINDAPDLEQNLEHKSIV